MQVCELDLGADPWLRLEEGAVRGRMFWNGGEALPVTVAIRGAHSRRFPRKSLQVTMRGEPLPDGPPSGHTVRRLHLNADYIDPTRMRSALSFNLFHALGAPAPLARHTWLSVNDKPQGIYVGLESVDADFCRRRGWPSGSIFYAVNRNANFGLISPFSQTMKERLDAGYRMVDDADPEPLRSMISDLNLASERAFPRAAERWIDTDGYLRWLMVAVFVGNRDGFVHNYALCHDPESRKFRIIPWDYDATWGIDINGRPARLDRVPLTGWNKLTHRMMAQPRYRSRYKERFLEALAGPLASHALDRRIDEMATGMLPWLDTSRQQEVAFRSAVGTLKRWGSERGQLLESLLQGF